MEEISNRNDEWRREVDKGKMFGILVTLNTAGEVQYLAGYSGIICGTAYHKGFVPPIFDCDKDARYIDAQRKIAELNQQINSLSSNHDYVAAKQAFSDAQNLWQQQIAQYKQFMAESKAKRDELRQQGANNETLINESQFQKAEFKRLKARAESELTTLNNLLSRFTNEIQALRTERKLLSERTHSYLFDAFIVSDSLGNRKSLAEIFSTTPQCVPPSGTGECAAPKLLQYAFDHNLTPLAMGEFWWGESPKGVIRAHGTFYPACTHKCKPLLNFMLNGLEIEQNMLEVQCTEELQIIYEDNHCLAVNKPAGLLSTPALLQEDNAESRVRAMRDDLSNAKAVHRLDMATSGILLFAKDETTYITLQQLFARRQIQKRYLAILARRPERDSGSITLPLRPDREHRPMQVVDYQHGKPSITDYRVLSQHPLGWLVEFYPHTGRTHQIRVHAAHAEGLNAPIVGDTLYAPQHQAERLMLHAETLSFPHPEDEERRITIQIDAPFHLVNKI